MKQILLLLSILVPACCSFADWKNEPSVFIGYKTEDNIFKSPATYGILGNLSVSDSYILYGGALEFTNKISKKSRAELYIETNNTNYQTNTWMNPYKHNADFSYRYEVSKKTLLKLIVSGKIARELNTDIFSEDMITPPNYMQAELSPLFQLKINKQTALIFICGFRQKDYEEVEGKESRDYYQNSINIKLKKGLLFTKTKDYLNLEGEIVSKYNTEYTARDKDGYQHEGYPKRKRHYYIATAGYERKIGKGMFELTIGREIRNDPFEGYYSYESNLYKGCIEFPFISKSRLKLKAKQSERFYSVKLAEVSGDRPNFTSSELEYGVEFTKKINKKMRLSAEYKIENRDTNHELPTTDIDRDYVNATVGMLLEIGL